MNCIKSSSCRVLWIGEATDAIHASRGLRQGDLLSSYLFVLCMEKLSHWIEEKVASGDWKSIQTSKARPRISQLFFADDLMLFAEAMEEQVSLIKQGLKELCDSSGQRVNFSKSLLYFSLNVPDEAVADLSNQLGILPAQDLGKYLGYNLVHMGG